MKRTDWTVDEIRNLINTNDMMVIRSLVKLYERQTDDEITDKNTQYRNNMGFNSFDAPILTKLAEKSFNYGLTNKDIEYCRTKIMKYAKQITKIANGVC